MTEICSQNIAAFSPRFKLNCFKTGLRCACIVSVCDFLVESVAFAVNNSCALIPEIAFFKKIADIRNGYMLEKN